MLFIFPNDGRWNSDRQAVEFSVGIGDYTGVVRIGRRVFQALLSDSPTPERCVEAYHLDRTHFEMVAEPRGREDGSPASANSGVGGEIKFRLSTG